MYQSLIQTAQQKLSIILSPVRALEPWCVLCTNSGGKARYWVVRGDDDEVYAWRLSRRELIDLEELTNGEW